MPQVIPAVVAAVKWVWAAKTFIAAAIKYVAIVYATTAISRALQKKPSIASLRSLGSEVNVRDPAAPRQIIYGKRRVSGVFYPVGTSGTKNEFLHVLLLVAGHEVEELGKVYFNDEEVTLDGSGNATGKYAGYVRVLKHTGTYNQTVDTSLQSDLGSGTWTNNHRLQGIAYLYLRFKHNPDLFAGVPDIYCDVKGRKVFDPRDNTQVAATYSTWKWSDNAALCLADWVRGVPTLNGSGTLVRTYGLGALDDEIDATALTTAANICDESVVTDSATEARYTANGVIMSSTRAGDGIDVLKSAMAGDCVYVGGTWLILAGAYRTPTVTLTQSDLRAPLAGVRLKPSRKELCNTVRGVYVAPENNWQPTDFPPVKNATYKTQDGGEDLPLDIELPFTTSPATAQRLGKIIMERSRQGISFTLRCKLTALQVQVGDVILFTYARFGWTAKPFEVLGFAFTPEPDENDNLYLGVDLTLKETASGVWDWANGEETTVDLAPNTDLPNPFSVPTPTAPTLTSGTGVALQQSDGTILNRIKVVWTAPASEYVTNGGRVWIEYKQSASSDWITWANDIRGDQTQDFILDVKVGTAYDVRLRFENSLGVRGSYSSTSTHTVASAAITPSDPTAATKTAQGTYTAGDGSVYAYLTFTVPALPANAAKQFLMYKRSSDTDWLVAAGPLTNTADATVTLNDLSPGVIYAIATLALSSLDVASNYVPATSSPFTAPNKSTGPDAPTNVTRVNGTSAGKGPVIYSGTEYYTAVVTWDKVTDKDLAYYEWVLTTPNNTDAAADAIITGGGGFRTNEVFARVALGNPSIQYFRVRSVNTSGAASAWVAAGDLFTYFGTQLGPTATASVGTTAGTVAAGDDSRIIGAAQKSSNLSDLASASTARTNLGVTATGADTTYAYRSNNLSDLNSAATALINLGVRSAQFVADVGTSGGGSTFKYKVTHNYGYDFEKIIAAVTTDDKVVVAFDYNDTDNDTNNSVFIFRRIDGATFSNNEQYRVTAVYLK